MFPFLDPCSHVPSINISLALDYFVIVSKRLPRRCFMSCSKIEGCPTNASGLAKIKKVIDC